MKFLIPSLVLALSAAGFDLDVGFTASSIFPVGSWGEQIGAGLSARASAQWKPAARIGAGASLGIGIFGDEYDGDASVFMLSPEITGSFHLRPWGRTFNPGIEAGFGMNRTSMECGGGSDPASWDPFWRAGLRWDFGMGSDFRGAVGFDLASILSQKVSSDSFSILFRLSREVEL